MEIEQVESDSTSWSKARIVKLSWSKHVDTTVDKMRRSLSLIKRCSVLLTTLSTRQVLQALVSTLTTLTTRQVLQALV